MIYSLRYASLVTAALIALGGCAGQTVPPVIEDADDRAPIERTEPADETAAPVEERPTNAATSALIASAEEAIAKLDHTTAIVFLERAVRIAPRDAELWIRLSASHLQSGNVEAAQQHARKAIALAQEDSTLTRLAWLQLANVFEAQGQANEAASIRRRYSRFPS